MSDAGIRNLERIKELEDKLWIAKKALEFYLDTGNYSGGYYSEVSSLAPDTAEEALAIINSSNPKDVI